MRGVAFSGARDAPDADIEGVGAAGEFASLAVELIANSYMNAESVRIDAGIRMQPK